MKVVLGLGNPGLRYKFSRHNLGFLVVKELVQANKIELKQRAFACLLGEGRIKKHRVLVGFPLTFMNLSGQAVAQIVKQNRIKLIDLLIVCDDINLPLGRIRLRAKGSYGGHQGLRSIIQALNSEAFPRLRIGIGLPKNKQEKDSLSDYVLGTFKKREMHLVKTAIEEAVNCCLVWVDAGLAQAMNRFNRKGD